ncbi:MAG: hypothetical protein IJC66_01340 [Kiritimatiellae bacterium]|nr:hypothetical protein [Kiritimatiellia bacterium]
MTLCIDAGTPFSEICEAVAKVRADHPHSPLFVSFAEGVCPVDAAVPQKNL